MQWYPFDERVGWKMTQLLATEDTLFAANKKHLTLLGALSVFVKSVDLKGWLNQ